MEMEAASHAGLLKVGVFVLVQALVYLILSKSSAIFSRTKSLGLRTPPARSASTRRLFEVLSELTFGTEISRAPSAGNLSPVPAADRTKKND